MKYVLSFIVLMIFSGCALPNAAQSESNAGIQNLGKTKLAAIDTNANISTPVINLSDTVNPNERDKLEIQNKRFRQKPVELNDINFKNFSFPYKYYGEKKPTAFSFKNKDEYTYDFDENRGWFAFVDEFYVDLTGDNQKEAIVILWNVSCGGSCDGGAGLFYVYEIKNSRPNLLWQFETGSLAYGSGLKAFRIKEKLITVEQFGECPSTASMSSFGCNMKFGAKDFIRSTFAFDGKKVIQKDKETIVSPEMNVMNYNAEINIDD